MTARRVARFACAVFGVGWLSFGCHEPFAPNFSGAYTLRSVANESLPTLLQSNDYVRVRVFADTLRLAADGTGSLTSLRTYESLTTDSAPQGPPTLTKSEFWFRALNERLEITFLCPPNADCVAGPHLIGELTTDGLRLDYALGQRVPLRYARFSDTP